VYPVEEYMSLTFHQTFRLEKSHIMSLMKCIDSNSFVTNEEIHEITGIGIGKNPNQGKVQPTIDYATFCGLLNVDEVEGKRRINFTDVGRLVYQYDPKLRNRVTHWVMHYHLVKKDSKAEAWAFFFNNFLPNRGNFTRTELESEIESQYADRAKLKSINPHLTLACYTDGGGLEKLRLIREINKDGYMRSKANIPNCYILGYILADYWETNHTDMITLDTSLLMEPGNVSSIMGLDEVGMQKWLDILTENKVIEQMRAVAPIQIVKIWDKDDDSHGILNLLEKSYQVKRL
jgi:hypothetical protein